MTGITLFLLFLVFPLYKTEEHVVNELYTLIEKGQSSFVDPASSNQSRLVVKEPSLPINELLEKSSRTGESKFNLHPLPSAVWPKHSDLAPIPRHHSPHNKSKKGLKSDRLVELNSEKTRGEVAGLLPKTLLTGATATAANRTVQRTSQDTQSSISPPQQTEPEGHPNSRPRGPPHPQPAQPHQPAPSPRRDPPNRRLDPEENRPGKSSLYQSEPDFTHDAFCMSECRKEKEEREYYCYSEFAVNGIVHDIDMLRKGIRLITLMVSSDGFYKMSRLYVTPDSFFFKVRLLVLDTYKCSKPCPDIKLGTRYIVMGQIYHRRRHLPNDLLNLLGGKLKPGDGLLRSNNYVKRFNKRRHQKALEATRSRCR
ncbi:ras guanine nucleotide exchange factor L-like isoform X2 [Thunnus albacares]|uniref:ras guanine nucleotide exchange factor L-like isoform X2 n=1 Tax=Thunnus maccoyii TaxID=8240 RepID=UPI001C4B88DC|nr:ras guanine nucleotide exchange factor L-like isoform X2 [Thunnus maccoyii]XP_044203537.1 ras guanine nucleotide exchange factor L-like isoform X2 [Thunnus albacares]